MEVERTFCVGVGRGGFVAEVLADDRAVLALDELSLVCRARDLVNSSMWRASNAATVLFRAVVGVKAEGEGEGSEQGAEDRRQARGMEVLDRADELELGDLVHQVHVVQAFQVIQIGLVDGIDPDIAGAPERRRPTALANGPGLGASGWRWFRGAVDTWSSAAGCRGGVGDAGQAFEPAVAKAMVGARTELARGRPGQGAVEPSSARSPIMSCSGGGGGAPRGGRRCGDPMLGHELGAHLGQKTSEQTLLSLPLVDIVEPAQGAR